MRTSMITTCGRRRSTSATAPAPSEASPITRTCGARESDRRSPSRTTSWSSTIRQVISSGIAGEVYSANRLSHTEGELLGLRRWRQPLPAPVADAVLTRQFPHLQAHRLDLGAGEIRAARVELLVALELLGPVARERLEKVLLRPGCQVEEVGPDPGRTRL